MVIDTAWLSAKHPSRQPHPRFAQVPSTVELRRWVGRDDSITHDCNERASALERLLDAGVIVLERVFGVEVADFTDEHWGLIELLPPTWDQCPFA